MFEIFFTHLDIDISDEQKDLYMQYMTADRKARIERLKRREAVVKNLLAGLFVARGIEAAGFHYDPCDIYIGEHGKPLVLEDKYYFNLSHSHGLGGLVVGDKNCGFDVQKDIEKYEKIEKRVSCENELKVLESVDPGKKSRLFTLLWSAKEAYLKYTGDGIRKELTIIDTSPLLKEAVNHLLEKNNENDRINTEIVVGGERLHFTGGLIPEYNDHTFCLCTEEETKEIKVTMWRAKELCQKKEK
ncbi:MAG: 4'-phosphopantetheinyl transferase superfamily protein [Lachnospiraceae bacterium]|nr:4'-phosphopantetheinyl transferase superfamily protein [Lachnospiraceae bacterium]